MKFKPITPGMVIHCPKEEDARALLEHLESLGYKWYSGDLPTEYQILKKYNCYTIYENRKLACDTYDYRCRAGSIITEFSDLIESDASDIDSSVLHKVMTTTEILQWLMIQPNEVLEDVLGYESLDEIFRNNRVDEIIDGITAYEAAKATKPTEVEWGYRCCIYYTSLEHDKFDMFGVTEGEAENEVRKRLKDYAVKEGRTAAGEVMLTCGVKED